MYTATFPRRVDGTGEKGEVTVSTDCQRAYVHDGVTPGGLSLRDLAGGGLGRVSQSVLIPKNGPMRIIPFGDSITQGSSNNATGNWWQSSAYGEQSIMRAGPRYCFVRNAGIAGNTTAQMLARIQTDVLAYAPDIVLFMAGTNDMGTGLTDAAYAAMMNNVEAMVLMMLRQGIQVVLVTPPPNYQWPDVTRYAVILYYLLAWYYNLPLIDVYGIVVDPVTSLYKVGYSLDGVHPAPVGIDAIANAAAPILANLSLGRGKPYLAAYSEISTNNRANLLANGSFAQQTVPGLPDFWNINTTGATYTLPAAAAPMSGVSFVYNKTAAGGAYALYGPAASAGAVPGDTLVAAGRVTISGLTPATAVGYTMEFDLGSTSARPFNVLPYNGVYDFQQEMLVPAGALSLAPNLFVQDVGIYTVNNLTVWNKSAALRVWTPGLQ